jgi:hypothetical protein
MVPEGIVIEKAALGAPPIENEAPAAGATSIAASFGAQVPKFRFDTTEADIVATILMLAVPVPVWGPPPPALYFTFTVKLPV